MSAATASCCINQSAGADCPSNCTWLSRTGAVFKQTQPHSPLWNKAFEHPQGTGRVMNTSFGEALWCPGEGSGRRGLLFLQPLWIRLWPRNGQDGAAIWTGYCGWCVWVGQRSWQSCPAERKGQVHRSSIRAMPEQIRVSVANGSTGPGQDGHCQSYRDCGRKLPAGRRQTLCHSCCSLGNNKSKILIFCSAVDSYF